MSQIDHAEQRLSDAGLADDSGSSSSSSSGGSSSGGNDNTKWIIIGSVVGGVVLIALIILGFFLIRRYRKRKAYNMVHKGNDNSQAASGPGMSGGLMPLWMHRSANSANNNTPSIVATPPAETDDQRLRRYSQTTLPPSNRNSFSQSRDMFNADDGREATENDSLRLEGAKFKEEEFHSAYDGVDTGYGAGMGGDRRSQM